VLIPNWQSLPKFTSVQATAVLAVLGALTAAVPAIKELLPTEVFSPIVAILAFLSIGLRAWKQNIAVEPEVKALLVQTAAATPVVTIDKDTV
jgi:hypothetical protein